MQKIAFALQHVFMVCILFTVGCAAPAFLMNSPTPADQPSEQEEIAQTLSAINTWNGIHISKIIQKWGKPHRVTDDGADSKIYTWPLKLPVHEFLADPGAAASSTRLHPSSMRPGAAGIHPVSMDALYELTFYTNPKGIVQKTLLKESTTSGFSRPARK